MKRACAIVVAGLAGLASGQPDGVRECGTLVTAEQYEAYAARALAGVHALPGGMERSGWVVPVVFHVVRRGDGTGGIPEERLAQGMIDLDAGFAGSGLSFCRPVETRYIDDDALFQRFDSNDMDVMLAQAVPNAVNVVCAPNATSGGMAVCGAATLPGWGDSFILMRNSCLGVPSNPTTFTHEMGHYFDLLHTHDGYQCADGRDCDITGDLICDTPPDPRLSSGTVNSQCEYTGGQMGPCHGDSAFEPDTRNFMSYSRALCREHFSQGQIDRMVGALLNLRPELAYPECPDLRPDPGMMLASRRSDGGWPNWHSLNARALGHGRFIAFDSLASDLVEGDVNGKQDVFRFEVVTGEVRIVSVGPDGSGGTGSAYGAQGSADGALIAFMSTGGGYGPADTNGKVDVYLKDMAGGSVRRISIAHDGGETDGDSYPLFMAADGRFLLFGSEATNIVPGDTNGFADIFLCELDSGAIERVSLTHDGAQVDADAGGAAMSDDGRLIVFSSKGTNIVPGDTNGVNDVFLLDRGSGTLRRLSAGWNGGEADGASVAPSISGDGNLVSFVSKATNLVEGDANGAVDDGFVHDLRDGSTRLVTVGFDGSAADGATSRASISGDGRYVVMLSAAKNLVPFRTPPVHAQGYLKDLVTGRTELISRGIAGSWADGQVASPVVSRGGRVAAFCTSAENILDLPGQEDFHIFALDRRARCPGDFDDDGERSTLDVLAFLGAWAAGDGAADANLDGLVDTRDVMEFLNAWAPGC